MTVKAHELRSKTKDELLSQLTELKEELGQLRVAKVTGGAANKLAKIKVVRKSIARVLTVFNQKEKDAIRETFADKKYKPKAIRAKQTRAMRRALTTKEKTKMTTRAAKKVTHFPQRKYALRV